LRLWAASVNLLVKAIPALTGTIFMKSKFALIGDIHFGPAKFDTPQYKKIESQIPEIVSRVVEQINSRPDIEFVVHLGDLVQESTANPSREQDLQSARYALSLLGQLKKPLYHVAGNHDRVTLSHKDLTELFGTNLYYAFETDHFKNIVLYCESPAHFDVHLIEGETEWLREELVRSEKPVLIFMHQLLVEHPLEGTSCEGIPGCAYVRNKEEIKQILVGSNKVQAVFNGHMHHNFFKEENGIGYFTIQAMTEPVRDSEKTEEAYAIVEIDKKSLSLNIFGNSPVTYSFTTKGQ